MSAASLIVPLAGLATAPVLAHALGVPGRGAVAAAIAPNVLLVSVATLGLPEALTFFLAKFPLLTRKALLWSAGATALVGVSCLAVTLALLPLLSGGDAALAHIIKLAVVLAIPLLLINVMRGAACGRQMWGTIVAEKLVGSILRVVVLLALALAGSLTVESAILTIAVAPIVAGLAYWPLLVRPVVSATSTLSTSLPLALAGYGGRVWLGSVASMLLARLGQVMFLPLSNVSQLALYVVAMTVADVPIIASLAVRDALFSVNSKVPDARSFSATCRVTVLVGMAGTIVIGSTLPWWIGVVFGGGFEEAVPLTWALLLCSVLNIPGFLVAAGLGAWGRPGLRSLGLTIALVIDIGLFVVLVPAHGALGAAAANLASSFCGSLFMLICASRIIGLPITTFFVPRLDDIRVLRVETGRIFGKLLRVGR
jgi:O-antigen/teichoic acid export membrane protein